MKITSIKQQLKQTDRYSIFVEGKYAFSLSGAALLEATLINGQELSQQQIKVFKQLSEDDRLYNLTLRYVAMRSRSLWEIKYYLQRKKASPALVEQILNKLSIAKLLNDQQFAEAFVRDRRLLRPASRRKITLELRQKRVADDIIKMALGDETDDEQTALQTIITQKRRQTRYQNDLKLMQYLARQGFNYNDIKAALQK